MEEEEVEMIIQALSLDHSMGQNVMMMMMIYW